MKKIHLLIIAIAISLPVYAQNLTYDLVRREYESFEYEKVIALSEQMLIQKGLPDSLKIDLFIMRAVSFYSLGNEEATRSSFAEILKLKPSYLPDPTRISPKLISIFELVKSDFVKAIKPTAANPDTVSQKPALQNISTTPLKISLMKNLILPGWGLLNSDNYVKGWVFTSLSAINIGALVYFIGTTNKKESDYLNETDVNLMKMKYDEFNSAYKTRNVLIITYAALWIYSQLDFLLLGESPVNHGISSVPAHVEINQYGLSLNFKVGF